MRIFPGIVLVGLLSAFSAISEEPVNLDRVNRQEVFSSGPPAQQDVRFNALLEDLRASPAYSSHELAAAFSLCIRDTERSVVHRDYALQHLGHLYIESDLPERELEAVYETAERGPDQLAATALRTLERVYSTDRYMDRKRLEKQVLQILDKKNGEASFLSALHLCATLQLEQALPIIRSEVFSENTSYNNQLVALYALGELGSSTDAARLNNLNNVPPRSRLAYQSALSKLENKLINGDGK